MDSVTSGLSAMSRPFVSVKVMTLPLGRKLRLPA